MKKPKLSVVMSCYNAERTVEKAVESILNQSFRKFEFIIIDDASTDNTLAILNQYQKQDSRITLLINEINQGLSYSLNRGIREAWGPLIARMDADDISYSSRLQIQYDFMQEHQEVDILGTAVRYVDHSNNPIKTMRLPSIDHDIKKRVFRKTLVFHPTVMLKKEVYEKHGYYDPDLRWAEDADLWYRVYDKVVFHNLPDVLLDYTIKSKINRKILKNNLLVKWTNLNRRGKTIRYMPLLIKEIFTLSLRSVKNY
jgi:glycosyltransferase involved in cell wall biosynthesis